MSASPTVVGVDVGTTSTKVGVYRLDGSALATAGIETRLLRDGPGVVEQCPDELLDSVCEGIAAAVAAAGEAAGDVRAIALTGQMASVVGIDEHWRAVTPCDSWLDTRCAPQLRRLSAEHGALVTARTGCPPMVDHLPKMRWWREERPAEHDRVVRWVMPAVHLAGRLAGLSADEAFIDPSYLHFTGVADAAAGAWSHELLDVLGIDAARMPTIVPSDAVVGELTAIAAARCSLRPGTAIVAGAGDTAAGALGAGIVEQGHLLDTAGTAAVLTGSVADFRPERGELITMRGALDGQWLPLNYVAGGGLCLDWLGDLSASSRETLLAAAAEVEPGAEGARFVPHLEGRVVPHDPAMRGGWQGLGLGHGRGHLARAVLEGIAFEYSTYLRAMRQAHGDVFTEVSAIGGGARSSLWNQIKADVLGLPVTRVQVEECATRGAALLAASAVAGIDLAATAADVPAGERVEPDAARHDRYGPLVDRHVELVAAMATSVPASDPRSERPLVP